MTTEIELLTIVEVTSLTPNGVLWAHRDLKGRQFSDHRQTLTAEDLRQITEQVDVLEAIDAAYTDGEWDEDPDSDGYGWERRALTGVC